ncbi:MAG: carboxypeptidase M32 [Chitinophagaceae bacterium]
MNTQQLYDSYHQQMQRIADVRHASAVLQWDQETYLPPKGAALRGQQLSTLSELAHQLFIDDGLGELLQELMAKGDLDVFQKRNVELTLEDYTKAKKYSSFFVRQLAEQINKTFHAWIEARKQNSFAAYQKDLETLVQLKKEESEILGYQHHPYNAHLNEYEKGATVNLVDKTFDDLLPQLKPLLDKIAAQPQVEDSFLKQHFPKQAQWDWGMHLLKELHFDFEAGRQDISEHPFSTSFGPQDVRVTTRIDEADFTNMTWSCIHEAGHALYEQGLPPEHYGLPLGEACSYSIHESQSRLWENNVGRSLPFWQHYYGQLQQRFPEQLGQNVSLSFYKAINKVAPSLIRTEADEITYHFHVYIRYQLEKSLLEGSLATADIPQFWNEQYKKYLGVTVPDDKRGCLQDVHWSHGSFGYFPTYSLGSFYAAQFFAQVQKAIPGLQQQISQGQVAPLLNWLRTEIHAKGRYFTSEELCRQVTGEGLQVRHFMDYLLTKYTAIYNL